LLLCVPPDARAAARPTPPPPAAGPRLVLRDAEGAERIVQARDLVFVIFRRTFYQRNTPRSVDASGRRIDVEDRREDCRCVRFDDESRAKFKLLREIEIRYPEDGHEAIVRLTWRTGRVREVQAGALAAGQSPLPPRFAATIDGMLREYPLVRGEGPDGSWQDERLVRVLFVPEPPPPRTRR